MGNAQKRSARILEIEAKANEPKVDPVTIQTGMERATGEGHNADTLANLLTDIDKLHTNAVSFVTDAVKLYRRATQYLVGPGNGNSQALAKLTDTLEYLGKRGLVVKAKAWTAEVVHFEYHKLEDGKASFRKAKKKDPLAIFNVMAWEKGFMEWTPVDDGKEAAEWTLEAHIRKAIKRLVKETKITEADARLLVVKAAQEVPLITIVVPDSVAKVENVGALQANVDTQANDKDAQ